MLYFISYKEAKTSLLKSSFFLLGTFISRKGSRHVKSEMAQVEQNWTTSFARRTVTFVETGIRLSSFFYLSCLACFQKSDDLVV